MMYAIPFSEHVLFYHRHRNVRHLFNSLVIELDVTNLKRG